jgi:alkylation response protein AidB-like acyl-CoA dehydrogenase
VWHATAAQAASKTPLTLAAKILEARMNYQPNLQDIECVLLDVLKADAAVQALPVFEQTDADLMRQVLGEAVKFVSEVVAPLQRASDTVGCLHADGKVTMPPGFCAAHQTFWRNGWGGLSVDPADGGQGLPEVLNQILFEQLSAACHGWTMAPGLMHGAYECIKHHASDDLKASYLDKVGSGEWLATMCLTEPHAGSDLGLVRTKATLQADGSYAVSGSKIFISGGDHDLTDNIVHLVLARLPDAPAGPKGLSLFLAPKVLPNGQHNGVYCDRIEEKMGLHGSPTCAMRFDQTQAWIVGEPGRGLVAMFVMMNAARLHVALQGIGLLEAAWQIAHAYAQERRQMRAPLRKDASQPADVIAEHPAIQRILQTQRAWIDAGRVLAYQTSIELDNAKHHADPKRKAQAQQWCSLVTPVLKSAFTEQAFHGSSSLLQVLGGHGYVSEWGIEQIVRDSRVAMIYEGTNEIQAIDLLVRKVLPDGGAALNALLDTLAASTPADAAPSHARQQRLRSITAQIVAASSEQVDAPYWMADDYLRAVAIVLCDWAWQQIGQCPATQSLRWSVPHQAFERWILPELAMRLGILETGCSNS